MKPLLVLLLIFLPIGAIAQYDFSAIADIEKKQADAAEVKRLDDIARAVEKAKQDQRRAANKAKLAKQRQDAKDVVVADALYEKRADKSREQSYEDELRALNLQVMRAKADRTNDYIDADLAKSAANTDGIQADADRTRMGGTAEIKRAENPTVINTNVKIKIIDP